MKTFIYTERPSSKRGYNVRITVYRIKRNRPHLIGSDDFSTASWKGAHGEAVTITHENDGIPYGVDRDGGADRYTLRGELGPCSRHDDHGHHRDTVRLFGV